jgi:hypothetical protein
MNSEDCCPMWSFNLIQTSQDLISEPDIRGCKQRTFDEH